MKTTANRTVHVAMLRGVNVGQNTLKMDRLRVLCSQLGMANVRTYLQSGNIVFEAPGSSSHWEEALERTLTGQSRLAISVIVRTAAEIASVIGNNPFLKEGIEPAHLHVTFLRQAPAKTTLEKLAAANAGPDRIQHAGKEIYLHCPSGYGNTKLSNHFFEKALSIRATTRNWKTVGKLYEMSIE